MAPQISTPSIVRPDGLRRSKNQLMVQWRHRSFVRRVPGLYPFLMVVALGLDASALCILILLLLPPSWQPEFLCKALSNHATASLAVHDQWLAFASLASVLAGVNAATGTLASSRIARICSLLTSWFLLVVAVVLGGLDLSSASVQLGPNPLTSSNHWFVWTGCWAALLTLGMEWISRRCWILFAGASVTAFLFTLARHWPVAPQTVLLTGIYSSRLGMLFPQILQVGSNGAFALAWMFSLFFLTTHLIRPASREPGTTFSTQIVTALRTGLCLEGAALILDSSWGGAEGSSLVIWHPSQIWPMAPALISLAILGMVITFHCNRLTTGILVAGSFTILALGWIFCHPLSAPALWLVCTGVFCLCLVTHTLLMECPPS